MQKEFLVQIGRNVKAARKARKITLRKLGEMCDLDYSSISRLENGQRNIHILTLKTIAEKMEMDLKELI